MNSSKYKLVVFVRAKGHLKSIEIVPSEWIYYDKFLDKLFSYYPENKSNNKDIWKKIETMIKEYKPPQKSWPVHEVDIHGIAGIQIFNHFQKWKITATFLLFYFIKFYILSTLLDSYEETESKLCNLTKQSYVFTTNPEISAKERSLMEKNKYKFRATKNDPKEIQDVFDSVQGDLRKRKISSSNIHGKYS